MKRCSKCGEDKDESDFHRNKRSRDGLQHWCKECNKAAFRKYYRDNSLVRKRIAARVACRRADPIAHEEYKEGLRNWWHSEKGAAWKAGGVRKAALQRRRAAEAAGDFTKEEWAAQLEYFGNRCAYCNEPLTAVHAEHVEPLKTGGTNTIDNIVPACPRCNLFKKTKRLWAMLAPLN